MQGIRDAGFVTATPIQEAALPLALKGKDVAGQSQTGTGKTAAFLIAAFTRLLRTPAPPPAPVTSPRVLDHRAHARAGRADRGRRAAARRATRRSSILAVYGGIDYNQQRDALADGVRRAGRHAGPAHRLPEAARVVAAPGRGPRHRRGRPHVRHGVHRRPALHPPPAAAAREAPVVPVLGHAVVPRARADVGVHEQPSADHHHAAAEDGRARGADALPRRPRGEVRACCWGCCAARAASAS